MMTTPTIFYAISLDPDGRRYQTFTQRNTHLGHITIFNAIRGADISNDERVASGLMTAELVAQNSATQGTVGCAASHRAVWRLIAASTAGAVIMEDDVITHPGLTTYLAAHKTFFDQIDIMFFGINTDSVLATFSAEGLYCRELMSPTHPDPTWIGKAFKATSIKDVRPFRLLTAFGLCCYWVTPLGAKKLLEMCYPLTLEGTDIPFMRDKWPGSAIDGRMNAFYKMLNAYVLRPFLAYSPNDDSSTSK
jgi:glycosyl transferase, family 25